MHIITRRQGSRPEDERAKRLISENAGTIRKLADQISNGGFSRMRRDHKRRQEGPEPQGLVMHYAKGPATTDDGPDPYIRISPNNRVVVADASTGRQLQMLGEIRGSFMDKRFVLATRQNGYISAIDETVAGALGHFDERRICEDFSEDDLAASLGQALGLCRA